VQLESAQKLPVTLHHTSTIRDWLDDPRGKVVFDRLIEQIKDGIPGYDEAAQVWHGMDLMPLSVVLGFFGGESLDKSADVVIEDLLAQAYAME
jgi:beta-glucosidase